MMQEHEIEAVQVAVVTAINAIGIALLGSDFAPITSSPIPDEEVARILMSSSVDSTTDTPAERG